VVTLPVESKRASNILLFDDFTHGRPRIQGGVGPTTWNGASLWTLNNVNPSTVWFPAGTTARFSNFQYSWPPAVSLISNGNWTVQSRLVLLERLRAWNFTNASGSYAWQTALEWGSGSAAMGYGTDNTHSPATGVQVGGECFLGTLTTNNLLGQWVTANITLSAPTQTIYFSIYDSNGGVLGQASTQGLCGTMFGTSPVQVLFFTDRGVADVDSIAVTT
jgi:hypothetical protein